LAQQLRPTRRRLIGGAVLAAAISVGTLAAVAAQGAAPPDRLDALEAGAAALGLQLDGLGNRLGVAPVEQAPRFRVAQNREVAQINVRLDQLEEQMRVLTGQVEGLQFQMTQVQALIERLQQDYELRFQDLEGGASGKTEAVPQSGGATPSGAVPPQSANLDRLPAEDLPAPVDAGDSLDPLLSSPGDPEAGILGSLPADLFDAPAEDANFGADTIGAPSDRVTDADAQAQYNAGYDALQRGDYAFAETQLRQFIGLYPGNRLAPEATTWLGETLLRQQQYDEAAQVLVTGYEAYPASPQAPAMLLRLGMALAGAGERETACRTYIEILRRYTGQPESFMREVVREQRNAQC
jgi:tol-pal system protein YbgF